MEEEEDGESGLRKRRVEGVDRGGGRRRCRMWKEDAGGSGGWRIEEYRRI